MLRSKLSDQETGFNIIKSPQIWHRNSSVQSNTVGHYGRRLGHALRSLTRMWANAQRDGRPAEHRWRPLFNAAEFGWRPLPECRAVTLPILGCPKLPDRSQPLVGRSSSYSGEMWKRYWCLISFFPIVDTCLSCKDKLTARQSCAMVRKWRIFGDCLRPLFSASRVQYISNLQEINSFGSYNDTVKNSSMQLKRYNCWR